MEAPSRLREPTLRCVPQPQWLPGAIEIAFDSATQGLMVEVQFSDVERIGWYRRGATPPLPATTTQTKAAAIYQTSAPRCAWEVARTASGNLAQIAVVSGCAVSVASICLGTFVREATASSLLDTSHHSN